MKKRMEPLEIETHDEYISISQDDYGDGVAAIHVSPEQVETLITWLQEAKAEYKAK